MKKILFISAGNRKTNPRISKEIDSISYSYHVFFVGFKLKNWAHDNIDSRVNTRLLTIDRTDILKYVFYTLIERTCRILYPVFKQNLFINASASSKRSLYLINAIKKMKVKPDVIVAHTLASLYPAYFIAKKLNIPFSFDIEDWHPGEIIEHDAENEKERRNFLMKKILPKAAFITYASPFFKEKLEFLLGQNCLSQIPNLYVANAFLKEQFNLENCKEEKIQMVWFSQNIASGRGLELFIPILYKFRKRLTITLIGNLYDDFYQNFLIDFKEFLLFKQPMTNEDLNNEICKYDIGLASDLTSRDVNRDIAITNKIVIYAQAGLFVLATDTRGHKWFLENHSHIGSLCEQNEQSILIQTERILNDIQVIRDSKIDRFNYSNKNISWNQEKEKVVKLLDESIN